MNGPRWDHSTHGDGRENAAYLLDKQYQLHGALLVKRGGRNVRLVFLYAEYEGAGTVGLP